jgi:hypothetical protein
MASIRCIPGDELSTKRLDAINSSPTSSSSNERARLKYSDGSEGTGLSRCKFPVPLILSRN